MKKNKGNKLVVQDSSAITTLSKKETNEIISFVTGNVMEISKISDKVIAAKKAADEARNTVEKAKKDAESAKKKAQDRQEVHWYSRKAEAINSLQGDVETLAEAQVEIAESQIRLAEVQQKAAEAQAISFEFQKQLATATAQMIKFSTVNIATSQMIVRELEARMNGASKEELSELARKELETVVYQIKAQQDVMSRQDQLTDIVREMNDRVNRQDEDGRVRDRAIETQMQKGLQRDLRITEQTQKLNAQQRALVHQQRKDEEHDRKLAEMADVDEKQNEQIAENRDKNEEQDRMLTRMAQVDETQDRLIAEGIQKDDEQDRALAQMARVDDRQDGLIAQNQDSIRKQEQLLSKNTQDIQTLRELIDSQSAEISELKKKLEEVKQTVGAGRNNLILYLSILAGFSALVLSVVQFLL